MSSPVPNAALGQATDRTAPAESPDAAGVGVGQVWSLDVTGLDPRKLAGETGLEAVGRLFDAVIVAANLHPVASPIWHLFGGEHAGLTGIVALSESHLACHTFPEHGGLTLDLYTCVARPELPWELLFREHVGTPCSGDGRIDVRLRSFQRALAASPPPAPGADSTYSAGRSEP